MSQTTYLSTAQTAAKLGLSTQTILTLAKTGKLKGSFIASRWRFEEAALDLYVASQHRSE